MKIILVMLSLIVVLSKQQQNKDLFGKWKLVRVETNNETLIPTMDFFLTISEGGFGFNRDVNVCSVKPIITETTIEFGRELCTRVCCDDRYDPIGGMNLYRGNYIVTESSLIIQNESLKTYLEKIENER